MREIFGKIQEGLNALHEANDNLEKYLGSLRILSEDHKIQLDEMSQQLLKEETRLDTLAHKKS